MYHIPISNPLITSPFLLFRCLSYGEKKLLLAFHKTHTKTIKSVWHLLVVSGEGDGEDKQELVDWWLFCDLVGVL